MKRAAPIALILPLLLAACGSGTDAPGAVSPSEAQALNDAAAMLDANSVDANAVTVEIDPSQAAPKEQAPQ